MWLLYYYRSDDCNYLVFPCSISSTEEYIQLSFWRFFAISQYFVFKDFRFFSNSLLRTWSTWNKVLDFISHTTTIVTSPVCSVEFKGHVILKMVIVIASMSIAYCTCTTQYHCVQIFVGKLMDGKLKENDNQLKTVLSNVHNRLSPHSSAYNNDILMWYKGEAQ